MKIEKLLKNDITTLLLRMAIVFVVMWVLRVVFYLYNTDTLGVLTTGELPGLLKGSLIFDAANFAYTFGLFVVMSLLPFRFRETRVFQKILYCYYVVALSILVLLNLGDTVYFHYVRKRITIDEFSYAENDNTLLIAWKAIVENWYMLLLALILIASGAYLYRKIRNRTFSIKGAKYYIINTLILFLAVFCLVTAMRGGVGRAIRPITLSNAAHFASNTLKSNIVLGNPFCILRTIGNKKIKYIKYFDEPMLDSLYRPIHSGVDSAEISRKNIVIFVMESFSHEHSAYLNPDLYPDGQGYTPFLDSLMQQGYIFDRCYSNGGKSIDALPSILTSIPSFKTPFALTPQALSPMRGIGTLLGEEGWQSWFFNGSEERSMGFVAFAKSAGIENIRTRENYEAKHGKGDFDGYWGIWDEPFLKYMAEELGQAKEPFIATTFTLSSHHPFVVPDKYKDVLPEGKTKAHKPVAYTDMAMRHFFDAAKRQDWYKNTIFVVVADHVSSEIYGEKTKTDVERHHIIYFLYAPDGSLQGRSEGVTQQIDIMPTLLGILGYNKPYFAFGNDVFSENRNRFAINYNGAAFQWITDSVSYTFEEAGTTGNPAADDNVKAFIQRYYQQLERHELTAEPLNNKQTPITKQIDE